MKKLTTILAVLLLLGTTTALAADYPTDVTYSCTDGLYEVRKTYELPAGQEPNQTVKADFTLDGYSYTLIDTLRRALPEHQSRDEMQPVTLASDSCELADILPLLPSTKAVTTEDGFTGQLALDASSIRVEPAGYKRNSWTVTATRTYPNLSDMDMQYIPKTTTENGRTLEFAAVDWQADNTANVDDYEIGDRYTAQVTYSGTATGKRITGYTVTADYSGTVERIALNKVQYVAIFRGTAIPPEPQPFGWRYLAIPAGLLALILTGIALAKWKKRKGEQNHEEVQNAEFQAMDDSGDNLPDPADSDDAGCYPGVGDGGSRD